MNKTDIEYLLVTLIGSILVAAMICLCTTPQARADYLYQGSILHDSGFGQNNLGVSHGWTVVNGVRVNYTAETNGTNNSVNIKLYNPQQPNKEVYSHDFGVFPTQIEELIY